MPSLTLYFGLSFADENWAGLSYQLDCPGGHRHGVEWILGRLPTCDLTINIRNVSRRHVAIAYSYAADRWSVSDLGSQEGTFLNGKKLAPGDVHSLKVGDCLWLASNPINVVEDEQDTIGDHGPPTVASTEPVDYRPSSPPSSPPALPPATSYADNINFALQWLATPTTWLGGAVRLVVVALVALVVVLVFD